MARKLILFTCPKCKRQLVWANETAMVYCQKCDRWLRKNDLGSESYPKTEVDQDQLLLF